MGKPFSKYTLNPLSEGGLCDAVIWIPATAGALRTGEGDDEDGDLR